MAKGSNRRHGKMVTGGHSTRIEGLDRFVEKVLEEWPEVTQVRIGQIQTRNRVGRKSKRLKTDPSSDTGLTVAQAHKRAHGGGGFGFRATRLAMVGTRITGIKCDASYGNSVQEVVLCGHDLDSLKARLCQEGYGATWQ